MPYCVNCGVELDAEAAACPLCLAPLPGKAGRCDDPAGRALALLDPEDREKLTVAEGRTMFWELLSVSLGIGALVVLAIDLLDAPGLGWSLYPLASIALAWVLMTASLLRTLPFALRVGLAALAPPAFLIALDLIVDGLDWSLAVAVPIALAAELCAALAALAIARSRRKGANVAAIALAAAAAFCFALEAILDFRFDKKIAPGWSSIVLSALLPISLFLFYLHYRILGKKSLRRFFRL
jgi:peptidoglycan/LPS O-acetylase OafA/YrhL